MLVAAVGLIAGCGSTGGGATAADTGDAEISEGTGAGSLDPAVFDGEATTVDGASYDLGALAGADLVVWFWAPW